MEYRNLGRSGLRVSVVGIGCNNFGGRIDADRAQEVVDGAIDAGVTLFDTADIYGDGQSEGILGKALGGRRQDVIVATKFGGKRGNGLSLSGGASRRYIVSACEASLRRLGTDYIDLYQVHFPDPLTPLDETLRAMDDLVTAGKVRYIGHSNFSGWQAAMVYQAAKYEHLEPFVSAQNEYSLLSRGIEKDLVGALEPCGLGLLPYFPLASGLLTGKYRPGEELPEGTRLAKWKPLADRVLTTRNWELVSGLENFAKERGHSLLELAMGWLASKPYVGSVIAGATSGEQVRQNVASVAWRLTAEEQAEAERITA